MNYWLIFLTGLTTGGLSCLAMQGGLLASIIANQKEEEIDDASLSKEELKEKKRQKYLSMLQKNTLAQSFDQLDWLPVFFFLGTKLIAHVALGFLLGTLGAYIQLSLSIRLIFQTLAALFMLATAANLLDIHPIFRYVVFQPPKFVQRLVRNSTKSKAFFTPAVLGFLTIFIPCGVTQAMEVLAITSGNGLSGALIMFAFVLGTSPIFAFVGIATAKLSEAFRQRFMKLAAWLLIFMGLSGINGVLTVLDFPITFQNLTRPVVYYFSDERLQDMKRNGQLPAQATGVQRVVIQAGNNGYNPTRVRVRAGQPVELTVQSKNSYSCANYFFLKAFQISLELGPNDSKSVTFTPDKPGKYQYSCAMGMYTGIMEVL
ncbi:sulfite exporter TauE/SafE family protein [Patescibacteria group bacterium]|nr:sulfite exporter TauE/SafE family protein [Patescibacteria group bacterium]